MGTIPQETETSLSTFSPDGSSPGAATITYNPQKTCPCHSISFIAVISQVKTTLPCPHQLSECQACRGCLPRVTESFCTTLPHFLFFPPLPCCLLVPANFGTAKLNVSPSLILDHRLWQFGLDSYVVRTQAAGAGESENPP